MTKYRLHEVFKVSGVPTVTFVHPARFAEVMVSLETPGRCMILEGPSGIGKSTLIEKALDATGIRESALMLSARKADEVDLIAELPSMGAIGTVIVDDFHRLDDRIKASLSDYMKVLADTGDSSSKLILIGINKAGQQLVYHAHDLGLRLDVFRLESNPDEKIHELIEAGERALNVRFLDRDKIAAKAQGSFQIAQLLCHKLCVLSTVIETQTSELEIVKPLDVAVEDVMVDLSRLFKNTAITFAQGSKIRREGRAPYLHILKWLSEGDEWSLDLREAMAKYPTHKQSVSQVLDKGFLQALLNDPAKQEVLASFHYEPTTSIITVEDPRLIFYLKNLVWRAFTRQAGYTADYFSGRYDIALSFAGKDRVFAEKLFQLLQEREVSVFYDFNEQHSILATEVEVYLSPIYRSEARYVVAFLSEHYPTRIWTKFESDIFRERFGEGVIPIRYTTTSPGFFSEEQKYGALSFDPMADTDAQLTEMAEILCKKIIEDRENSKSVELQQEHDIAVTLEVSHLSAGAGIGADLGEQTAI
ncbi:TIR domain-containing protein [Sinorhizobium meliloti]|uniref:TIR domain-containing protein n=1 Tax=Rhizobium meliloti TaxID=382 RepID=UPI000FD93720|nr:TIR domain-containing protein [Sinorhizobium meliloti]MDE3797700.1 TIR domain-containing protein [Sinorhizobium meliloti]RVI69950.1 TIR domain-containing protein [Sinorhizobium meliloti]